MYGSQPTIVNNVQLILGIVDKFTVVDHGFKNNVFSGQWCQNGWTTLSYTAFMINKLMLINIKYSNADTCN